MKKIMITGAGSFIGTSFENYIKNNYPNQYEIKVMDTMSGEIVRGENFDKKEDDESDSSTRNKAGDLEKDSQTWNYENTDVVFHVAGIAHADVGKVSEEGKELYKKVNTDLAIETAKKAKAAGVKQFIFMSSAIVYGASGKIGESKVITKDTEPNPENFYGESKLNAEKGLKELEEVNQFKVVILRPPMIYGPGCKGNYNSLRKFALKLPLFPKVSNERSMLYIDNLCEFIRLMIDNEESGTFHPANKELSNTSQMVRLIAEAHGKKIHLIGGFTWALKIMSHFTGLVNKAFGNLSYADILSEYRDDYRVVSLEESIKATENVAQ